MHNGPLLYGFNASLVSLQPFNGPVKTAEQRTSTVIGGR